MDQTLKALTRILEEGKPELKIAAIQILGELRPPNAPVARALAARLSNEEAFLTPFVLEALSLIGTKEAIEVLVDRLRVGGSIAERVAHLLGQMGSRVTKALAPLFEGGDEELQGRVLGILGQHHDKDALGFLQKALLHHDPTVSERACGVLTAQIPGLDNKERTALSTALDKALSVAKIGTLTPVAIAQAVGVLVLLEGEKCRTTLLRFATSKNASIIRQAALRALAGITLTPAQTVTVLGYIAEEDMTHVVRPAMQLLEGITSWNASAGDALGRMLESDSEERCLFALRALRDRHTEKMGRSCLQFLQNGVPEFQEAAAGALSENPAALKIVLRAFQLERNVDRARLLAKPLAGLSKNITPAQLKSLVDKTAKLVTAGEPLGDIYLGVVSAAREGKGACELAAKALRLRRARQLDDALTLLMRLAQIEQLDEEGRYQLAVARLMADGKETRPVERRAGGDATMGYISGLIRDGFPVFDRLKKEGQLTPEDLLRVGRHFAEGVAQERRFGAQVLHLVATKHSRQRVGEEAKLMLRSEGL